MLPRCPLIYLILSMTIGALLPSSAARADGKFLGLLDRTTIPDQQALIVFDGQSQSLTIDTRFQGKGDTFAWILPLPAEPTIEPATRGLFPTLETITGPRLGRSIGGGMYFGAFYLGIACCLLMARALPRLAGYATITLCTIILLLLLMPTLGRARSISSESAVETLSRQYVGDYEVTTVAARDAAELSEWLTAAGFTLPESLRPVIANYISKGWVFATIKLSDQSPTADLRTPHPLTFRFPTTTAVYPMSLTAVDNSDLDLRLYIFGAQRAHAAGFRVEECQGLITEDPAIRRVKSSYPFFIKHPLLLELIGDQPVCTVLSRTYKAGADANDVEITWAPFRSARTVVYKREDAAFRAFDYGAGISLAATVIAVCFIRGLTTFRRWLPMIMASILAIGALGGALIYANTNKVDHITNDRYWRGYDLESLIGMTLRTRTPQGIDLNSITPANIELLRDEINRAIDEDDWPEAKPIEEDSPGNYTLTVKDGVVHLSVYDFYSRETIVLPVEDN